MEVTEKNTYQWNWEHMVCDNIQRFKSKQQILSVSYTKRILGYLFYHRQVLSIFAQTNYAQLICTKDSLKPDDPWSADVFTRQPSIDSGILHRED